MARRVDPTVVMSLNANDSINTTNGEVHTSGARFVPTLDLAHDDNDTNSHVQHPVTASRECKVGSDPVQIVQSLQLGPNQTGVNPWHSQYPVTCPESVPAVLGPQKAVQMMTQRARDALNDQREAARRVLLHRQGEFRAASHQYEAAARQNLVNTLARSGEAHIDHVQMHNEQFEHEADARFSQRPRELLSRFSQEAYQALEEERDNLATEVTSEVWRRNEQVHDLRTELILHAPHSEDVTQQQSQERAGLHQHLTGLFQETQKI